MYSLILYYMYNSNICPDEMAAVMQATFSNSFLGKKTAIIWN